MDFDHKELLPIRPSTDYYSFLHPSLSNRHSDNPSSSSPPVVYCAVLPLFLAIDL